MKKLILALSLFFFLNKIHSATYIMCVNGYATVYQDVQTYNVVTGTYQTQLHRVGPAGGCAGGNWIITLEIALPVNTDWEKSELNPTEYQMLSSFTKSQDQEVACYNQELLNYLEAIKLGKVTTKWADPLKVDPLLAKTLDLYQTEIYAPKLISYPFTENKISFYFRSNTGNNVDVYLINAIDNSTTAFKGVNLQIGENIKSIPIPNNLSGTFLLKIVSSKNSIAIPITIN